MGDAESGGESAREVGKGVVLAEREMPRISSIAVEDFEARRFEARKRARWARTLARLRRRVSAHGAARSIARDADADKSVRNAPVEDG